MPIQQMLLGVAGASIVEYTASNATNVSLSSVFGSDWAADVEKCYIIPSGVTLGATSVSNNALTAESGMGGTLTIKNSGTISGAVVVITVVYIQMYQVRLDKMVVMQ